MKTQKLNEKYSKLEREKRLNPDYVKIEREALKHGWNKKKKPKKKVKSTNKKSVVPFINQCKYPVFVKSKYWKYVRGLVLERDGHKCTNCGKSTQLQVHHLTYEHHYKEHNNLGDLVTLCRMCHEAEHSNIK